MEKAMGSILKYCKSAEVPSSPSSGAIALCLKYATTVSFCTGTRGRDAGQLAHRV